MSSRIITTVGGFEFKLKSADCSENCDFAGWKNVWFLSDFCLLCDYIHRQNTVWYLINSQIPITDKCLAFKLSKIIVAEAEKNAIKANFYFLELLEAKIRFLRVGRNSCECICCVTINAIFRNDCERGRGGNRLHFYATSRLITDTFIGVANALSFIRFKIFF